TCCRTRGVQRCRATRKSYSMVSATIIGEHVFKLFNLGTLRYPITPKNFHDRSDIGLFDALSPIWQPPITNGPTTVQSQRPHRDVGVYRLHGLLTFFLECYTTSIESRHDVEEVSL